MSDQTPREQLAEIIKNETGMAYTSKVAADRIISAGWRPPARVIETAEGLAGLPDGTILRDNLGCPQVLYTDIAGRPVVDAIGSMGLSDFDPQDLPVTVLHTPENGDTGE